MQSFSLQPCRRTNYSLSLSVVRSWELPRWRLSQFTGRKLLRCQPGTWLSPGPGPHRPLSLPPPLNFRSRVGRVACRDGGRLPATVLSYWAGLGMLGRGGSFTSNGFMLITLFIQIWSRHLCHRNPRRAPTISDHFYELWQKDWLVIFSCNKTAINVAVDAE